MQSILVFTKEGMVIESEVDVPLIGKKKMTSDLFYYDKLPIEKLRNLEIVSIQPMPNESNKDILQSLRFTVEIKNGAVEGKTSQPLHDQITPYWKESHIRGIDEPGRLGYQIQSFIRSRGKVTWEDLCNHLRRQGYRNPEVNGSVSEAIVILRDDLRRIKQTGYAEHKIFEWIG